MSDDSPPAPARTVLTVDAILTAATSLLDEEGVSGLTFRKLAARLGTGVASLYWHVANKDDLVSRAADRALASSLSTLRAGTGPTPGADADPLDRLRSLALDLYDQLEAHPWLGVELTRGARQGPNGERLWEQAGQQVARLGLPVKEQFYAVSTLINFVVGVGTQMSTARFRIPEPTSREDVLASMADRWAGLDADEFPFTHSTLGVLRDHDDREQFAAGLDLILSGLAARRTT